MHRPVALYHMLYGLTTIVGGILGYTGKNSMPSLLSGVITGVLLILAGTMIQKSNKTGVYLALVTSLAILGFFVWQIVDGHTGFMPYILMTALAGVSVLGLGLVLVQPSERKRDF